MSGAAYDVEKGNGTGAATSEATALTSRQAYSAQEPLKTAVGNPAPLGLFSFASTTFILSLINLQTRNILTPNIIVGMALGCGGLAQLLAGMWEFASGNTFGATAFSSYGAFWISFGLIFWPSSGIMQAYQNTPNELHSALGIYLMTWFIVTFLFFLASLRTHLSFNFLFGFLCITFILLAVGFFTGEVKVTKAGGGFGVATAMVAYYTGAASLINDKDSFIVLPRGAHRRLD